MSDLISRQAAIDAIKEYSDRLLMVNWQKNPGIPYKAHVLDWCVNTIRDLPSAEPERLTDDDFETIRIHLNACKEKLCNQRRWKEAEEYQRIIDRFMAFASSQPTVDVEPVRHGMFIGTEYDGYADGNPVYYEWKCSECGCIFEDDEPTYKYCPNCGAKMEVVHDSD